MGKSHREGWALPILFNTNQSKPQIVYTEGHIAFNINNIDSIQILKLLKSTVKDYYIVYARFYERMYLIGLLSHVTKEDSWNHIYSISLLILYCSPQWCQRERERVHRHCDITTRRRDTQTTSSSTLKSVILLQMETQNSDLTW